MKPMKSSTQKKCPCGSSKLFTDCCASFLNSPALPQTALQLMRSRYCAYVSANINYIQQTMCGQAAADFDPQDARLWAEQVIWCGLNIIDPGKQRADVDEDDVEFAARYVAYDVSGPKLFILHERSQFQKIANRWFYISGKLTPHQAIALKSSSPCPCGSKKRFLQCCGKQSKKDLFL
jgi:SEC-C motif-containing protein